MALLCYYIVEKEREKKTRQENAILTERIVREINISCNVQTG